MKIVYFGTPPFAAEVLSFLLDNHVEVLAVVTKPDKPRGRSGKPLFSAVKQFVKEKHPSIPVFEPDKASASSFISELRPLEADLFVVVAYGEIMTQELLDVPRVKSINLHASLLPKYRGAAPIQYALLEGAKVTGVTIIEMALKMDAGAILEKKEVEIPLAMNFEELEAALCEAGGKALLNVIHQYENGSVVSSSQNHAEATYVQKIHSDRAHIDWNQSAFTVHNQVRAFSPRPGAWSTVNLGGRLKRLKILKSKIAEEEGKSGETLSYGKEGWTVACGEKSIAILQLQLEGKKKLEIEEFSRGVITPPIFEI